MPARYYQTDAENAINEVWKIHQNILLVLPTGSGKTYTFAEILKKHIGASCAIAHRQELVTQISLALARAGLQHRIIGPPKVIRLAVKIHMRELGNSFFNPNAQCAVAGVDTLIRREEQLKRWLPTVTKWVTDECFPAGTLVDGRPIESIQSGDFVTSFNEATGGFEQRRVVRLFKNPAPKHMVRLRVGHHVLECTKGHPIWTKRGWINAGNITNQDQLYMVWNCDNTDDRITTIPMEKNRSNILPEQMRVQLQGQEPKTEEEKSVTNHPMSRLWAAIRLNRSQVLSVRENKQSILRVRMLKSISCKSFFRNNDQNKQDICIRSNEEKQPHVQRIITTKDVRNSKTNWSCAQNSGWKRSTTNQGRGKTTRFIQSIWFSITNYCFNKITEPRVSESLQDRLWKQEIDDRDRSRRIKSLFDFPTETRCEERPISEWHRVDSISVFKPENNGRTEHSLYDGYVYNIEVEGLHTYIAENIVVHNCHHIVSGNKWATACEMFPNAKGLGVTATPLRADGKGLGRHADGVFDHMILGPTMRELIDQGYLSDYRIFAPKTEDLKLDDVEVSKSTGEFNKNKLVNAIKKSHVVGDVVAHYQRIAPGKLGITFASDVETATLIAQRFNDAGVPAAVVSAKTSDSDRVNIMRRFEQREIMQVVNVDLFGEGYDVPCLEVVSMARPTASYGLYVQQFGRVLRILKGKSCGIVIDHVGNVIRHGLPDANRVWTLDRREKRSSGTHDDVIPLKACPECTGVYEATHAFCPYCGFKPIIMPRSGPEAVDGDLIEMDQETLAMLRGDILEADKLVAQLRAEMSANYVNPMHINVAAKHQTARIEMQEALRGSIAWWAGFQKSKGRSDSESYRLFYYAFGIDVMSAQTLKRADALALANKINTKLGTML